MGLVYLPSNLPYMNAMGQDLEDHPRTCSMVSCSPKDRVAGPFPNGRTPWLMNRGVILVTEPSPPPRRMRNPFGLTTIQQQPRNPKGSTGNVVLLMLQKS